MLAGERSNIIETQRFPPTSRQRAEKYGSVNGLLAVRAAGLPEMFIISATRKPAGFPPCARRTGRLQVN